MEFYEQLKKVRDDYSYPLAVHHQKDDGEASDALRKAKCVLVRHKPPLVEAYRGPHKVKSQGNNTYLLELEGNNGTEDQAYIINIFWAMSAWLFLGNIGQRFGPNTLFFFHKKNIIFMPQFSQKTMLRPLDDV